MQKPERLIPLVRAWAVLLLGSAAILLGFINSDSELLMLGFAVLGAEPVARSVSNGP